MACSGGVRPAVEPVAAPTRAPATAVLSSYRAPPGCPDEQAYVRSVESRSQVLRLRAGADGETADRLRVRIQPDPTSAGWLGQLQIEGEHALEREVRGERCADVALALALIAVLRLDARARPAPSESSPSVASSPGASSPPASSPSAARANPPPAEPSARAPTAAPPEPDDGTVWLEETETLLPDRAVQIVRSRGPRRVAVSPLPGEDEAAPEVDAGPETEREGPLRAAASSVQPSIAAHFGYVSAPSHALQARLRAELQLGARPQSGSVALGFGYASASEQNASADLDFALLSAQLDACPLALGSGPWLRGCAALSGGVFSVSARALDDDLIAQSSARAWAALGPSLEGGVPLGSRWTLRALAELSFLLVRDSFEVERIVGDEEGQPSQITRTLLYRPPVGAFAASLGLGYAF